jgi:YVTN family beta-propeller protein
MSLATREQPSATLRAKFDDTLSVVAEITQNQGYDSGRRGGEEGMPGTDPTAIVLIRLWRTRHTVVGPEAPFHNEHGASTILIDTSTDQVVDTVKVAAAPEGIAFSGLRTSTSNDERWRWRMAAARRSPSGRCLSSQQTKQSGEHHPPPGLARLS